jgi:hypothetical protein
MGEDDEHKIVVSEMDSIDSSFFNDSDVDEENFDDDEEAVDGQKAGVDVDEENFDEHREVVDGQKVGMDVDAINESMDQYIYIEADEQPASRPNLRPRGTKKDPRHILGGYGNIDFLFAPIDADASFSFLTEQMSWKKV